MATKQVSASSSILQIDDYWTNDDGFASPPSRDPYLRWAELTNFRSLQGGGGKFPEKLSFIVERTPNSGGWQALDSLDGVDVEAVYLQPLANGQVSMFASLRVDTKDLTDEQLRERVLQLLKHPHLQRLQLGYPRGRSREMHDEDPDPPPSNAPQPNPRPVPAEVVSGIIDDGCPFAHLDLRDTAGQPRLALIWQQTTLDKPGGHWASPAGFSYGRVLERLEMKKLIEQAQAGGALDEVLCYQEAFATKDEDRGDSGLKPNRVMLARESHGGSVMAVAAGQLCNLRGMRPHYEHGDDLHGQPGDAASRCPLIFVDLPREQVEISSGRWLPISGLDGLRFILQEARARFKRKDGSRVPVVVNLSSGSTAGSHTGGAMFECAMDELLMADDRLAITLAAGNSRDAESHAELDVPPGGSATVGLFVPPSQPFDTFAEFWFPYQADLTTITVTVTTPEGVDVMEVSGKVREAVLEDGITKTDGPETRARKRTAALFLFPRVVQATDRTMAALVVCGTVHSGRRQTLATAGPWRVTVRNEGKSALNVQCWVERDEVVTGTRRAQAARFFSVAGEKRRFEAVIRTTNTLSNIATGELAFPVGGYRGAAADWPMADYSGAPPKEWEAADRYLPFAAKSDAGKTHPGVRVPGNRANVSRRMNGTSVAAPQAARFVANQMAAGKTRVQIEAALPKKPKPLPVPGTGQKRKIDPRDGRKRL